MTRKPLLFALTPLLPMGSHGEAVVAFDCTALLGPQGIFPMVGLHHASFADLGAAFLAYHSPSLIILPLFSGSYDAIAAIELLESLGYRGRLVVIAPELPKPRLVEAELRGLGPGNRLTLISP